MSNDLLSPGRRHALSRLLALALACWRRQKVPDLTYSVLLNSHLLDSGRTTQDSTWCPALMGACLPARPRKPHRARRYIADDSYVLTCLSGRISAMTVPGRAIMIKSTSTSHTLRQAFHAGHSAPLPCSRLFDRINAP
jgi:hypothetical protein